MSRLFPAPVQETCAREGLWDTTGAIGDGFISDAPKTTEELQVSRGFYWRS